MCNYCGHFQLHVHVCHLILNISIDLAYKFFNEEECLWKNCNEDS